MNTAVFYSPRFLEHYPGSDHPEAPQRLQVVIEELNRSGLLQSEYCSLVEPRTAFKEYLELVHESEYIELVEKTCKSGGGILDLGDTVVSQKSCKVAELAVGALIDAVNLVSEKKAKNAFALVRPPGHHAGTYYALGFCLFNNIAIAASYLVYRLDYSRVLILDMDAHHGNGTQEIFYNTDKVLYISVHEDPTGFPGTGFIDEIGEGQGIGYTVNIPLPFRSDDSIHNRALDEIVAPICGQYKPEFVLVSAGFDGHYTDPVGSLSLSMKYYEETFKKIVKVAARNCDGKLVVALEGGYSLNFLGRMVTSAIAELADVSYAVKDRCPTAGSKTVRKAEQIIGEVKSIHSKFWKL